MHSLLLLTLLLTPLQATNPGENMHTESGEIRGVLLPFCAPPAVGDWLVNTDCWMFGNRVAPANVRVTAAATLRLAAGSSLDIDFQHHNLRIGVGSRVLIGDGARLH